MVDYALVVGNGPSRLDVDLTAVRGRLPVYGCNAIYRDHDWLDAIGALDELMVYELMRSWSGEVVLGCLNEDGNTGAMMVKYALARAKVVYLLGFDFTRRTIYAGTESYREACPEEHADETPHEWVAKLHGIKGAPSRLVQLTTRSSPSTQPFRMTQMRWDDFVLANVRNFG